MVRIVNSMNMVKGEDFPVKVEFEDSLEEEYGPLNKRSRVLAFQQWNNETGTTTSQPMLYNPLAESPIGLRLRKSPSLLELIQMRLSQGSGVTTSELNGAEDKDKDSKNMAVFGSTDKLKASNFPASLLRIGSWESVSRYEGDLVAKCYFAKHKLVWEVLDGGLKSKIEIQWSDITSLKAYCPETGNSTLDIVLARQPLFFRETNPQPRKHTLWQATSDFTGGQASINRRHFLQVPQGLLKKHFDKLIQCDPRLYLLSQKEEITLESPYFEHRVSIFEEPDDPTTCGYDQLKYEHLPPSFSGFQESPSPHVVQTSTPNNDLVDPVGRITGTVSQETPSPSSVMDSRAIEEHVTNESNVLKDTSVWNQFRVPGLSASMSKDDLVSHLEHCISEHVSSGNAPLFTSAGPWNKNLLDGIAEHLLSDFQTPLPSDEKSLMTRVNSLYSLLQKDTGTVDPVKDESSSDDDDFSDDDTLGSPVPGFSRRPFFSSSATEEDPNKQAASMSRKDSVGDLLLNLPRIASLPQFLFNMPDDADNRAR